MKKWCFILAVLTAALALAGCSGPSAERGGEVLTEPPALTVETGGEAIQALRGTYSWAYSNDGDTWTSALADSAHPLDCKDLMPMLETEDTRAVLTFAGAPDTVTANCWSDACWGVTTAGSEDAAVDEDGIELRPGGYIYEVRAEWNSREDYSGTAYYSFYIKTPDAAA